VIGGLYNAEGDGRYDGGMIISSKNPMDTLQITFRDRIQFLGRLVGRNLQRIPSSEDDLTFARITSDEKGRNTTSLKVAVRSRG
jgi:hypothetical protein